MEYKIRKIRARKSDSEIELEFETAVTLKEAEDVAGSALDKLLAKSPPATTSATQERTEGAEVYPSISKPESCSDAITKLLSTEWGKKPRTMVELKEAMASNAVYYPEGTFKSTFTRMTKDGKLRRVKKGDVFAYILP